jgi:hypothetical protein
MKNESRTNLDRGVEGGRSIRGLLFFGGMNFVQEEKAIFGKKNIDYNAKYFKRKSRSFKM